jgi:lipopolysaccharide/colanic/teichoic acid biosynthesis glycosyltransferase
MRKPFCASCIRNADLILRNEAPQEPMPLLNGLDLSEIENVRFFDAQESEIPGRWATSRAKRVFDITVVLACTPILLPLLVAIAVALRLSSGAPVLFRQLRAGAFGRPFAIYKFRTMHHPELERLPSVASLVADQVTPVGRILRRTKLDELPQVFNVLIGDMSLVGPRPKIVEQQLTPLACRPGITGSATLVFVREEALFAQIPQEALPDYYRRIVLPVKQQLDADYSQRSTLYSDLRILFCTLISCWRPSPSMVATGLMDSAVLQFFHEEYEAQSFE